MPGPPADELKPVGRSMTMPVPSTLSSPLSADMIIDAKTGKPRQKYLYEALSTDQDAHWKDQEFVKAEFEAESFKVKFSGG